jgi:L-aminopeptidase/D-esterase-like protein
VGKLLGPKFATKSGLGTASVKIGKGIVVGAIVAVNAFGDVVDPDTGTIIAGTRNPVVRGFVNTVKRMQGDLGQTILGFANTTLAVVATNGYLMKEAANKVAQMAHDGLARSIRPVHTMLDGDTVFALATGKPPKRGSGADPSVVGTAAAEVLAQAVVRAAQQAESLAGVPAACDLK